MADQAVLTSRRGKWYVKIGGSFNGKACFEDGWDEFTKSHGLEIGDFVVFEHQGSMHFRVSVYDSSSSENKFSSDNLENVRDADDFRRKFYQSGSSDSFSESFSVSYCINYKSEFLNMNQESLTKFCERTSQSFKRGRPRKISLDSQDSHQFITRIKAEHLKSRGPSLPISFWRSNKLEGMTMVLLKGPSEEAFKVKLSWYNDKFPYFCSGWIDFWISNSLKEGDICLFHLTHNPPKNLKPIKMDVQVFPAFD